MENWILLLLGLLSSFVVSRYVCVQLFICPLNGPEYKATYTFPVGVTTLWWFAPVIKLKEQLNATLVGNVWAIYPIFVQKIVQLMYFDHKKVAVLITQLKNTRGSSPRWIHTASDPANSHQLHGRTFVSDIGSPKFSVWSMLQVFRKRKNIGKQMYLPSIKACLPLVIRTLPFYGNPLPHLTTTKPSSWLAKAWMSPCILWFASLLLLDVTVSFTITPQS